MRITATLPDTGSVLAPELIARFWFVAVGAVTATLPALGRGPDEAEVLGTPGAAGGYVQAGLSRRMLAGSRRDRRVPPPGEKHGSGW